MNKLSKEKRNHLILVVFAALAVVACFYLFVIRYQLDSLKSLKNDKEKKEQALAQIRETIKNSKQIEADLVVVSNKLQLAEEDMASGDLYSAMINSISKFKQPYNVDIPQFNSGGGAADVNLLPKFPYKQMSVSVAGTAYYYDLGKFIAEFENQFPTSRVLNLELAPASAQGPDEKEKLSFRMDIVSLVKPNNARPAGTQ